MRGLQDDGGAETSRLTTAATGSPEEVFSGDSAAKKVPGFVMNVLSGFLIKSGLLHDGDWKLCLYYCSAIANEIRKIIENLYSY